MLKRVMGTVGMIGLMAAPAFATDITSGVVIDTAPVFSLATLILTAIGGIWAIKKVIKLANRS